MKSILMSIQPKWCELIASGIKRIEVRKTAPKMGAPFKVYIYCTKPKKFIKGYADDDLFRHVDGRIECGFSYQLAAEKGATFENNVLSGKVIGEFVVERVDNFTTEFWNDDCYQDIRVRYLDADYDYEWYDEFLIASNEEDNPDDNWLCKKSCLTFEQIKQYIGMGYGKFYGLHISQLKIYDKPKELGEFRRENTCYRSGSLEELGCWEGGCTAQDLGDCDGRCSPIERPPQSWMYVEEIE